jgi:copper(I)-binding protein
MFLSPSEPFREGDAVPVTLEFERAGRVEIVLPVRPAGGGHSEH